MAFTTTQRDALKAALATGSLRVEYPDGGGVTYRSLSEMRQLLQMMDDDIAAAAGTPRVKQIRMRTSSGF